MSHRPVEAKKRRRVVKALRRKPLPAYFDLVQHLLDAGHAKSKPEARKLILDERVSADSHVLGIDRRFRKTDKLALCPHVPAAFRGRILVAGEKP